MREVVLTREEMKGKRKEGEGKKCRRNKNEKEGSDEDVIYQ